MMHPCRVVRNEAEPNLWLRLVDYRNGCNGNAVGKGAPHRDDRLTDKIRYGVP